MKILLYFYFCCVSFFADSQIKFDDFFDLITLREPEKVKPDLKICRNGNGDIGFCQSHVRCRDENGLNIGPCEEEKEGGICCMLLPCSTLPFKPEDFSIIVKYGVRNIRSLPDFPRRRRRPEMEICGLREEDDEFQKGETAVFARRLGYGRMWHSLKPESRSEQIIGGTTVSSAELHPWMLALWQNAAIMGKGEALPICGAGLIDRRHALTAAHCVNQFQDSPEDFFVLGGTVLNDLRTFWPSNSLQQHGFRVQKIIVHPRFNPFLLENDIAIIRLEKDVTFRRELFPICLPPLPKPLPRLSVEEEMRLLEKQRERLTSNNFRIDEFAVVTGWGCENEHCGKSDIPRILREAFLPIVPNELAMCWFMNDSVKHGKNEYIPSKLFIVGGDASGLISTCRGDSGSPVTRQRPTDGKWEIIGIVSWSKGCGRKYRPSVWTRVQTYVEWILQNTMN